MTTEKEKLSTLIESLRDKYVSERTPQGLTICDYIAQGLLDAGYCLPAPLRPISDKTELLAKWLAEHSIPADDEYAMSCQAVVISSNTGHTPEKVARQIIDLLAADRKSSGQG